MFSRKPNEIESSAIHQLYYGPMSIESIATHALYYPSVSIEPTAIHALYYGLTTTTALYHSSVPIILTATPALYYASVSSGVAGSPGKHAVDPMVRAVTRSILPRWGSSRFRPPACTHDARPCGHSVRVDGVLARTTHPHVGTRYV